MEFNIQRDCLIKIILGQEKKHIRLYKETYKPDQSVFRVKVTKNRNMIKKRKETKTLISFSYLIRLLLTTFLLFAVVYPFISNMYLGDLVVGWAISLMMVPFFLYDLITDRK